MKWRNPYVVYLSRRTLDIFVALHSCAASSKFVLPSRYDADRCMLPHLPKLMPEHVSVLMLSAAL